MSRSPLKPREESADTLSVCQLSVLTAQTFVNYMNEKCLLPFASYFASAYNVPLRDFSYVIAIFNAGAILAVPFSVRLGTTSIRRGQALFCLLLALCMAGFSVWHTLTGLLVLRALSGFCVVLSIAQITGTIGAYLREGPDRTRGVMAIESAWTLSTLAFVGEGVVLQLWGVDAFWRLLAALTALCLLLSFLLPRSSIFEASTRLNANASSVGNVGSTQYQAVSVSSPSWSPPHATRQHSDRAGLRAVRREFTWERVPHFFALSALVFLMTVVFGTFMISTGAFLRDQYDLASGQLGIETFVFTVAELTALLLNTRLVAWFSNLRVINVSFLLALVASVALLACIEIEIVVKHQWAVLVALYAWYLFKEFIYLNLIVLSLDYCPNGFESFASAFFRVVCYGGSLISTFAGVDIYVDLGMRAVMFFIIAALAVCYVVFLWMRRLKTRRSAKKTFHASSSSSYCQMPV